MSCNFLQFVLVFVALATILGQSWQRELRPSEHGLAYQEGASPPAQTSDGKKMQAFFGAAPSEQVQLPEARNVSDMWRSARADKGGARDLGKDHVRLGLLVASAVCGLIGIVLLVVSFVVLLRRRLQRQPTQKDERYQSTSAPSSVHRQQYSG